VQLLAAPFRPTEVKAKPQVYISSTERAFASYVEARVVQERLDKIIGPNGWRAEFTTIKDFTSLRGVSIVNDAGALLPELLEKLWYPDRRNVKNDKTGKWEEQDVPPVPKRYVEIECTLFVNGFPKTNTGSGSDYKAAYSDAFKRSAVEFGIGRYLYDMPMIVMDAIKTKDQKWQPKNLKAWRKAVGAYDAYQKFTEEYKERQAANNAPASDSSD